jgi:hypothetical protein
MIVLGVFEDGSKRVLDGLIDGQVYVRGLHTLMEENISCTFSTEK